MIGKAQVLGNTLFLVCLAGVVLRVFNAFAHIHMIYPDEHFQTLEIANLLVNGVGFKAWEWEQGARSWATPALFVPWLWLLKLFGVTSGALLIALCRAFMALLGGLALFQFARLLKPPRFQLPAAVFGTAVFALLPVMIVWATTTFSETISLFLIWSAMPFLVDSVDQPGTTPRSWFLAGLILGVAFIFRLQMAFWALGFAATVLIFYRPAARLFLSAGAGFVIGTLVQGLTDLMTWGSFFHSLRTYYRVNLTEGFLEKFAVTPFYQYAFMVWENLGAGTMVALIVVLGLALAARALRFHRRDLLVLLPALVFLVAHSFFPHKEPRFILPALPAFFYLFAVAWDGLLSRGPGFNQALTASLRKPAFTGVLLAVATGIGLVRLASTDYYPRADVSDLSASIAEHGELRKYPDSCILFVHQFWLWTRGEMVHGHPVKYMERNFSNLEAGDLAKCRYAIIGAGGAEQFKQVAGNTWAQLQRNPWGCALFVKSE